VFFALVKRRKLESMFLCKAAHMNQESPARNVAQLPANSVVLPNALSGRNRLARRAARAGYSIMFVTVLLCCLPESLFSAAQVEVVHFPEVVAPGQSVTIPGKFDAAKSKTATVRIYLVGSASPVQTLTGDLTDTGITVKLPSDLKPGRYYLTRTTENGIEVVEPSELRIQPKAVQLDSPHPTTAYRSPDGRFAFDIVGQNFSERPQDNQVYVSGQGPIIKSWKGSTGQCEPADQPPCLSVESSEKLHVSGYSSERYQGPLSLSVGITGSNVRSAEKPLVLSRMSETGVLFWSMVIFLALGLLVYRLVTRGTRDKTINGRRYSAFSFFLIDKQTNSYSLSKFQLLLLFSCFVFGYLYVFLCRWLVQWQFVLPDVPSSFSGILAMSAGTTVLAAGATQARGSKGAGAVFPSAADFISIGGQVMPERFQFFVWTLVASLGFVALLLSQNPATIIGFPEFPQGLLYVMGISAGGYLAGKVTRAPGPIIRNIAWDPANSEITIQGENLSSEADFWIDDTKLPIDPRAQQNLVKPTPQDQAADRTFCSQLKITITSVAGLDLRTGDHIFRIMNKDGQYSDAPFTADPPTVSAVHVSPANQAPPPAGTKQIPAGKEALEVSVAGSGFRPGLIAKWTPAGASEPVELTPSAVQTVDSKNLKITLTPGQPGSATLTVITPKGFSATATVTVV
jgi:hypothetical protein